MMWVMMWVMGTMTARMLTTTQAKGIAGMPAKRGGGLLAEDTVVEAAAAGTAMVVAAAYCRGHRECNIPVQKSGRKGVEKKPQE
jgi:hypothetical protein